MPNTLRDRKVSSIFKVLKLKRLQANAWYEVPLESTPSTGQSLHGVTVKALHDLKIVQVKSFKK